MEKSTTDYQTVDQYIALFPPTVQQTLHALRAVIKDTAPEAKELISYKMPAYMQNGPLAYFGAFKDHISFFPTGSGVENFKNELADYKHSKGTVQFPLDQPIPFDLIRKIIRFKLAENLAKTKSKK